MKEFKRILLGVILSIVMIGVCGCMSEKKQNTPEMMKDLALDYLNSNYKDTFQAEGYAGSNWAYNYATVTFLSMKYEGVVEVRIFEGDGNYVFQDDYFKLYMEKDAEQFFTQLISKHYENVEIKVDFSEASLPENLQRNADFRDYVNTGQCSIRLYIITNDSISEEIKVMVLQEIAELKIKGLFKFLVTNNENLFDSYTWDEVINHHASEIIEQTNYSINKEFEIKNN